MSRATPTPTLPTARNQLTAAWFILNQRLSSEAHILAWTPTPHNMHYNVIQSVSPDKAGYRLSPHYFVFIICCYYSMRNELFRFNVIVFGVDVIKIAFTIWCTCSQIVPRHIGLLQKLMLENTYLSCSILVVLNARTDYWLIDNAM